MISKIVFCFWISVATVFGQSRKKPLHGEIFSSDGVKSEITYSGFDRLIFTEANDDLKSFFSKLTLSREGRKQLVHLLSTNSHITLIFSPRICILYRDSLYRVVAGLTGPESFQSDSLILEYYQPLRKSRTNYVFSENTLTIFNGCLDYICNESVKLDTGNVFLYDWKTNKQIKEFSMDTIHVEPFMHPELLYQNITELYYFSGIHEIEHLKPENIRLQILGMEAESRPMKIERKAFRRRKTINKRSIKRFGPGS